ncbi:MAG: class I SAM-dependent methyltransferase [Deltaproteobacteria bacterium]|nr:class I SAM-dependent methyltransferase [Deltaproteobacteria bacterium]MBI4223348.1 class I SAM-dependent methyltransferase [Deltaproteobacteria bacterium]
MELPRPNLTAERIYIEYADHYGTDMVERHIRRYLWAQSHLKPTDTVLDAACGSGYGSLLLKKRCKAVVGMDISEEAIDYAKDKLNGKKGIDYKQGDLSQIGFCDLKYEKFDVIVCIEAIEHITEERQNRFLAGVLKRLSCDGRLLITTPIKQDAPRTEFHVKEFTSDEFRNFLTPCFEEVVFDSPKDYRISPAHFSLARCSRPRV